MIVNYDFNYTCARDYISLYDLYRVFAPDTFQDADTWVRDVQKYNGFEKPYYLYKNDLVRIPKGHFVI